MTTTALIEQPLQQQSTTAWVTLLAPAMELARIIKNTDFVPRGLRGNEAAITAALLTANELGVGGMTGLGMIHIIDGRPALAATLQRALVLSRGHDIWWEELKTTAVTCCGRRRNSENVTRVTWTREMGSTAGLLTKDNWKKYPRAMLEARASSELCRAIFADCLAGLVHSIEELEDGVVVVDAGGDAGGDTPPTDTPARRRRPSPPSVQSVDETPPAARPALPGDAPAQPQMPVQEAAPGEEQAGQASAVLRKLFALFGELTIKDRGDRLAICSLITKRAITSSKDLTADEVSEIVEMLEGVANSHVLLVKRDGIWKLEDAPA